MKRFSFIIFFIVLPFLHGFADSFTIKSMNGQSIQIGNRTCKVNSQFSSDETIYWARSNVTIIEAQNDKTRAICYFVPTGKQNKDNSSVSNIFQRFLNYFTSVTHQSTREVESYSLDEILTNEFFLVDTLRIKINPGDVDEDKKYFASFYLKGEKKIMSLPVDNGELIFERRRFETDDIILPYKFILTVYYEKDDYFHEITRGMSLTVVNIDGK